MKPIISFIRFSRPHTIAGTTLSILSLYLIALSFSDQQSYYIPQLIFTLISCLGANIYIVGLNQITDIEIDRINKPWLPLASGYFSKQTAYGIISFALAISFVIAFYFGNYLLLTVFLSLLLGTAYSLPPLRLKRYYFWAAFCIIAVRGMIVNIFLFLHFHFMMSGSQIIPVIVWLLTATIFIYSIAIAWFKDIPDMEGDKYYKISTLTLRMGASNVFYTGNFLLGATILALIAAPFFVQLPLHRTLFSGIHILMLVILVTGIFITKPGNKKTIRRFYLMVWLLFFLEYIAFGVACFFYSFNV